MKSPLDHITDRFVQDADRMCSTGRGLEHVVAYMASNGEYMAGTAYLAIRTLSPEVQNAARVRVVRWLRDAVRQALAFMQITGAAEVASAQAAAVVAFNRRLSEMLALASCEGRA